MQRIQTIGIRGAGLAGVSVACELLKANPQLSISLFDKRPRLPHPQRTFCFFGSESALEHPTLPSYSWKTVLFRGPTFERRIDVSASPYTMIRGDDFFERALEILERDGVSCRWGCDRVEIHGNTICVDREDIAFDRVIDAAFDPAAASSMMWQSFAGVWVQTDTPSFDPTTATLMDLQESSTEAPVSFLYILPTSQHTALIEHTTFSPTVLPEEYHTERCITWLKANLTGQFELQDRERGAIPMGLKPTTASSELTLGTNAGAVRPATGYAFLATQAQAQSACHAILNGHTNTAKVYPGWLNTGDRLFLQALVNSPKSGEALLGRLLSRAPSDALIAFLAGRASPLQALSVWFSAPKIAMIKALLRI